MGYSSWIPANMKVPSEKQIQEGAIDEMKKLINGREKMYSEKINALKKQRDALIKNSAEYKELNKEITKLEKIKTADMAEGKGWHKVCSRNDVEGGRKGKRKGFSRLGVIGSTIGSLLTVLELQEIYKKGALEKIQYKLLYTEDNSDGSRSGVYLGKINSYTGPFSLGKMQTTGYVMYHATLDKSFRDRWPESETWFSEEKEVLLASFNAYSDDDDLYGRGALSKLGLHEAWLYLSQQEYDTLFSDCYNNSYVSNTPNILVLSKKEEHDLIDWTNLYLDAKMPFWESYADGLFAGSEKSQFLWKVQSDLREKAEVVFRQRIYGEMIGVVDPHASFLPDPSPTVELKYNPRNPTIGLP